MKLYLKQRVFSWGDKFHVYDQNGQEFLTVQGEVFSWGKKLHIYDQFGQECAFIRQKLFSFLPRYYISRGGVDAAEVVKEFTFFRQEYTVNGLGWSVRGDFWAHEYALYCGNRIVAAVSKEWFAWGDTYELRIAEDVDPILALAVVLVIDACNESSQNND